MFKFKCTDCGKIISGRNEYEAEVKFDMHCDKEHPFTPEELEELLKEQEKRDKK
jgi:hypothetical protein